MKVTGLYLGATQEVELNNGKKARSFYLDLTDNPDYPNTPEFSLYGDKTTIVNEIVKGELIEVSFDLMGKQYEKKGGAGRGIFTKLQAWKVEKLKPIEANVDDKKPADDVPF